MAVIPNRPWVINQNTVWDTMLLDWVPMTQPGGSSGGGPATIADGADVVEGSLADAAVVTDAAGTVSGKLRGLVKWAFERMPASLGQKAMAASFPVVLASDQSALPITFSPAQNSASGTIGALNDNVILTIAGTDNKGASFTVVSGNLTGVLTVSAAPDGTNYEEIDGYRLIAGGTFNRQSRITDPAGLSVYVIAVPPGTQKVKVEASSYTSGSIDVQIDANSLNYIPPSFVAASGSVSQGIALVGGRYASPAETSGVQPFVVTDVAPLSNALGLVTRDCQVTTADGGAIGPLGTQVHGWNVDTNIAAPFPLKVSDPDGSELALITRNIPSGVQDVDPNHVETVTGTLAATNDTIVFPCSGCGGVTFKLTGNLSGTVLFQGSNDGGVTYDNIIFAIDGNDIGYPATVAYNGSSTSAAILNNAFIHINGAGLTHIRATCTAGNSGTSDGVFYGTAASSNFRLPSAQISADWGRITDVLGLYSWDINSAGAGLVRLSSSASSVTTVPTKATTGTRTQVADTASDTLILASNSSRLGAIVYNDSSALLYLGLGTATVTATDYTARVYPNGYYEVPANYSGQIRGIWASDPNDGAARVTELT